MDHLVKELEVTKVYNNQGRYFFSLFVGGGGGAVCVVSPTYIDMKFTEKVRKTIIMPDLRDAKHVIGDFSDNIVYIYLFTVSGLLYSY